MPNHQDSITQKKLTKGEGVRDRNIPHQLKLHICLFSKDRYLIDSVTSFLPQNIYKLKIVGDRDSLIELAQNQLEKIDCLVLSDNPVSRETLSQLQQKNILLPVAIGQYPRSQSVQGETEVEISMTSEEIPLEEINIRDGLTEPDEIIIYHSAEIKFNLEQLEQLSEQINLALAKFLNLTPQNTLQESLTTVTSKPIEVNQEVLRVQQRRLTEKLKERLGYLGVYYKRNSQDFYRNLNPARQKQLHQQLTTEYRKIILNYFEDELNLNQIIDSFVNLAFFSDISVSKILEIHMDLMDEFAQQLKLEGRNEDILLDYRLALIDIVAHLCEMYRRSIPRDDIPLDALFKLD